MITEVCQAMHALDPELPLYGVGNLEQMLGFAFFQTRTAAVALSVFGMLAEMLAATGIHGLVAYSVAKRSHEIGIRIALGARPGGLLKLMLRRTTTLLVLGSIGGLALALALERLMASVVYQSYPGDPFVVLSTLVGTGLEWDC